MKSGSWTANRGIVASVTVFSLGVVFAFIQEALSAPPAPANWFEEVKTQVFSVAPKGGRVDPGKSCLECHSRSGGNRGGINLETYRSAASEARAIQDSVLNSGAGGVLMPPSKYGKLSAEARAVLKGWLDAGAPEFHSN